MERGTKRHGDRGAGERARERRGTDRARERKQKERERETHRERERRKEREREREKKTHELLQPGSFFLASIPRARASSKVLPSVFALVYAPQ